MIGFLWRIFRAVVMLLVLGGGLYFGGPYLLTFAGRHLITQDPLVKADIAVVLPGQPFLCAPEAARLYHEELAGQILLVNAPRPPGQEELLRVGIRYPDGLEIARQILEALRVPRKAILTMPERPDSTQEEAELVARFLAERSVRRVIVVTTKAHTTRARRVFADRLGPKVELTMHPAPADPFDPGSWWKDPADVRQAVWEYGALANLWARRLWRVLTEERAAPPPVTVR